MIIIIGGGMISVGTNTIGTIIYYMGTIITAAADGDVGANALT